MAAVTSKASSGDRESTEIRKRVRFSSREQLQAEADAFFADLKAEEDRGIGGANVLLSCALERTAIRIEGTEFLEEVVLCRPEAIGFRRAGREQPADSILHLVRAGRLVLEQVVGGPSDGVSTAAAGEESG
jgi:hypothetical protein